jgi:uncharacterized protein (TIGR00725 family)
LQRYVAVVGPGEDAGPQDCAAAREVGRLLAERGAVVVTGGLGGVMAAAADGAASAGGVSLGLLPGTDRGVGNNSTVLMATGLGELRNGLLIRSVDGVVAVGGSWGTLSEIASARRGGVPVVCLAGWSVQAADATPVPLETAATPDDAVRRLFELVNEGRMDG